MAAAWVCASAAEPFRVSRQAMPAIVVCEAMRPFVMRAVEDVAGDMEAIFGVRPEVVSGAAPAKNAIVLSKAGDGWENYTIESLPGNVLKTPTSSKGMCVPPFASALTPGSEPIIFTFAWL